MVITQCSLAVFATPICKKHMFVQIWALFSPKSSGYKRNKRLQTQHVLGGGFHQIEKKVKLYHIYIGVKQMKIFQVSKGFLKKKVKLVWQNSVVCYLEIGQNKRRVTMLKGYWSINENTQGFRAPSKTYRAGVHHRHSVSPRSIALMALDILTSSLDLRPVAILLLDPLVLTSLRIIVIDAFEIPMRLESHIHEESY